MSAIARNEQTGEMVRRRAVHGSAKTRERWHADYEAVMAVVAKDRAWYVRVLMEWMPILSEQVVVAIVGAYAHDHGLSLDESLLRCFQRSDEFWIETCREYGARKAA